MEETSRSTYFNLKNSCTYVNWLEFSDLYSNPWWNSGPNLENTVNEAAVRSLIQPICPPWRFTPCESQKTVAITFPADRTVFAFFEARSPSEVHCFDCSLVSGVYQWIHVSSTVTKRCRNSFGLRLKRVKLCSKVAHGCACCPEWVNTAPIVPTAFSCPIFHAGYDSRRLLKCQLSQLSRAPSIGGVPTRDRGFCHVILRGSRFRCTWGWLIKTVVRRATTLKLVNPIFDVRHRR